MSNPVAFAVHCHPDDIEFGMAGTLMLLDEAGYDIHYMNVANGSCGTQQYDRDEIVRIRDQEARDAAGVLGAMFHEPLVDDLDVFFEERTLRRMTAVIREVRPNILLLPSPQDYMEDHMNANRVATSAAFYRGMRNYISDPPLAAIPGEVTLYHAMPHGLRDALRRRITPEYFVDITSVIDRKREALACHHSQKDWLDVSQGFDSYLIAMEDFSREVGRMSPGFEFAEGWRRHLHLGFCAPDADPLREALGSRIAVNQEYIEELG